MNITLSADDRLIERARKYATSKGTTLNQLVRDYLGRLVGELTDDEAAAEFEAVARGMAGCSPAGWRFVRSATHRHESNG